MNSKLTAILGTAALAMSVASAHHSFSAEFDSNKPVTLEGTVVDGLCESPFWLYLDVKGPDGQISIGRSRARPVFCCGTAEPGIRFLREPRSSSSVSCRMMALTVRTRGISSFRTARNWTPAAATAKKCPKKRQRNSHAPILVAGLPSPGSVWSACGVERSVSAA